MMTPIGLGSARILILASSVLGVLGGAAAAENRSYDGLGNNIGNPEFGAKGARFARLAPAAYDDGISAPAVGSRENARVISNAVCAAGDGGGTNAYGLSDFVWQWGQFLDHDITLALTNADVEEAFFIEVGSGDPLVGVIPLMRTVFDPATGTSSPREQVNNVTSFIDASNVYGSDGDRAAALRTFKGGRLKTGDNGLMPMNTAGLPNANDLGLPEHELFLGGDIRANEQLGLVCMHTIFVREHNRLADETASANPSWSDDQIYHRARKVIGAYMQVITFNEFLPALLGNDHAPDPTAFSYDPGRDPAATNEFATALYRIGHTMVSDQLLMMDNDGQPMEGGELTVLDAFFNPAALIAEPEKLDWILMGLSMQGQMDADTKLVDNLRNQLFGPAGAGGLDLAALNIQRGRDHGLAGYNETRAAYGLGRKQTFAEITSNPELQSALASVYSDSDEIDLWIGGLAEDHLSGSPIGELMVVSLRKQFVDMAEGDRFFYRWDPELADIVDELDAVRLCDIIMRNSGLTNMQDNVFRLRPKLLTSISTADGVIAVTLSGAPPGDRFALERSVDGVVWSVVANGEAGAEGDLSIQDAAAIDELRRALYRFSKQE